MDYRKLCVELFGTDDEAALRKIAAEYEKKNTRNADVYKRQFCRRLTVSGPVHFVLDGFEEKDGGFCPRVIIHAGGVNVQNFSPEHLFG